MPNNHIFQNMQPLMHGEDSIKRRSLGRQFGQVEMNDPHVRNHLKLFLDQQIKEKNIRKIEDHEYSKSGLLSIFEPTDTMIKEM